MGSLYCNRAACPENLGHGKRRRDTDRSNRTGNGVAIWMSWILENRALHLFFLKSEELCSINVACLLENQKN